jgi:DNA-binding Lrp family transcriptional regulator
MSGEWDLLLFVEGDDLGKVAQFVSERLSTLPGVTGTNTHFMLKTYKHRGVLMRTPENHERLQVSP